MNYQMNLVGAASGAASHIFGAVSQIAEAASESVGKTSMSIWPTNLADKRTGARFGGQTASLTEPHVPSRLSPAEPNLSLFTCGAEYHQATLCLQLSLFSYRASHVLVGCDHPLVLP